MSILRNPQNSIGNYVNPYITATVTADFVATTDSCWTSLPSRYVTHPYSTVAALRRPCSERFQAEHLLGLQRFILWPHLATTIHIDKGE